MISKESIKKFFKPTLVKIVFLLVSLFIYCSLWIAHKYRIDKCKYYPCNFFRDDDFYIALILVIFWVIIISYPLICLLVHSFWKFVIAQNDGPIKRNVWLSILLAALPIIITIIFWMKNTNLFGFHGYPLIILLAVFYSWVPIIFMWGSYLFGKNKTALILAIIDSINILGNGIYFIILDSSPGISESFAYAFGMIGLLFIVNLIHLIVIVIYITNLIIRQKKNN